MREKILLIDDEPNVLATLSNILGGEGYLTRCETDGQTAMGIFQKEVYDLVICDIRMPKMDGLEVIRRIKQIREDTEVIILTAFASLETAIEALRDGRAYDYLSKPIENIEAFLLTIRQALEKARLTRAVRQGVQALARANEQLRREMAERKRFEEELLKAKKLEAAGLLAGGIAHDFNNLLMAIMGNINLSRLDLDPAGEASQLLKESESACMQARALTRKLIAFAHTDTPEKRRISLDRLLKDTVELALSGSNVRAEIHMADDLWPVEANESQMAQVLYNVVTNAREAMPDGGEIVVRAENRLIPEQDGSVPRAGDFIRISIEDRGPGISDEDGERIFDPYFSTKQRGTEKGMGLGLTICHAIIRNHRGYIQVRRADRSGTMVHIHLPAAHALPPEKEKGEKPMETRIGLGVLVMEDEVMIQMLLGRMLGRLGYRTVMTREGSEALAVFREAAESGQGFGAVILDLNVRGGMGGRETIGKLLELDPAARVIASSGYSQDLVMTDFRKFGFCAAIAKPYRLEELKQVLDAVFGS